MRLWKMLLISSSWLLLKNVTCLETVVSKVEALTLVVDGAATVLKQADDVVSVHCDHFEDQARTLEGACFEDLGSDWLTVEGRLRTHD